MTLVDGRTRRQLGSIVGVGHSGGEVQEALEQGVALVFTRNGVFGRINFCWVEGLCLLESLCFEVDLERVRPRGEFLVDIAVRTLFGIVTRETVVSPEIFCLTYRRLRSNSAIGGGGNNPSRHQVHFAYL
jgi:hypothetical protein